MKYSESDTKELKRELTDAVKEVIISFLNTKGGTIYVGINDDGTLNLKDLKSVNDEKASEYLLTQTSHPLSGRSTLKTQYF